MDCLTCWREDAASSALYVGRRLGSWIEHMERLDVDEAEECLPSLRLPLFSYYMAAESLVESALRRAVPYSARAICDPFSMDERWRVFAALQAGWFAWKYRHRLERADSALAGTASMFGCGTNFYLDWMHSLQQWSRLDSRRHYSLGIVSKACDDLASVLRLRRSRTILAYQRELLIWSRLMFQIASVSRKVLSTPEGVAYLESTLARAGQVRIVDGFDDVNDDDDVEEYDEIELLEDEDEGALPWRGGRSGWSPAGFSAPARRRTR
jgi:hypothetical protein